EQLDLARRTERSEIDTRIGETANHALGFPARVLVSGEIDDALALRDHAGRAAHLAINKARTLGGERRDLAFLAADRMRSELNDHRAGTSRLHETLRPLDDVVQCFRRGHAAEYDFRLSTDVGWRACRRSADLLEIGHRAAAIAEDAVAALDQIFRDRQS